MLFYTGKRLFQGKSEARYLGAGVIGGVWDTGETSSRYRLLRCETLQTIRFPAEVPLKDADNLYFESRADHLEHVGLYFSSGVRKISVEDYRRILHCAIDLDPMLEGLS
ncbi:hypothetical protein C5L39_07935 [Corynebacterium alimapuense]|uniref:Uncharacterized protein n=1 Tax=Corynebacterium alimapuense TaxID=1576874 RepID=A0A3M8K5E7_9CORY|nr:hypothetical protein C5L39_07935 [Corynebacterium alimapuense]